MKNRIITFGSATKDVFIRSEAVLIENKEFLTGKGICFPLGSKVPVDQLYFEIGGGGTNSATTFSRQGFDVSYFGRVGADFSGKEVMDVLSDEGISTDFVKAKKDQKTNFSVILDLKEKDRTILVYRGASELKIEDIPSDLEADWFYIAPLSENSLDAFYHLLELAKTKNIKVAVNPSTYQLSHPGFLTIFDLIDVLIVNKEEASLLTNISYQKEDQIFSKIDSFFNGIFIMTKGPEGLTLSDNKKIYRAKNPESVVVDRTGAGDAFGSGFISGLLRFNDVSEAIQLGIGNATGCLSKIGAKNGLLKKEEPYDWGYLKVEDK